MTGVTQMIFWTFTPSSVIFPSTFRKQLNFSIFNVSVTA